MSKILLSALVFLLLSLPAPAQRHGGPAAGGRSPSPAAAPRPGGGGTHAQAPARAGGRSYGRPGAPAGHPGEAHGSIRAPGQSSYHSPYHASIPGGRYSAYFGRGHRFVPWHGSPYFHGGRGWHGHRGFRYGGFYWGFDIWPYGVGPWWWGYDDPVYIIIEGGCYYAYDDLHPGQRVEVTPQPDREETGTVVIRGGARGDQVLVDKALAGYIGELGAFSLPAGPHALEVKGRGPYFGEDIMVLAGHELDIDVPGAPPSD